LEEGKARDKNIRSEIIITLLSRNGAFLLLGGRGEKEKALL